MLNKLVTGVKAKMRKRKLRSWIGDIS